MPDEGEPMFRPVPPTRHPAASAAASSEAAAADDTRVKALGDLPEWRLGDLYEGPDAPAFKADLDAALARSKTCDTTHKGTLAEQLADPDGGGRLATEIADYEALADLLGRVSAFASRHYVGDTTDPARG
jgi:oligoendopeptidase F